jgi:hypothetical protein
MREINRLLFRVVLVATITAIVVTSIYVAIPPDPQHYYRGSVLKLELLKNSPPPRIILVGGSNLAWGIDSELIERNLGMPVINDGLDLHIGVTPLVELREFIRHGDIIIVSLEYYNFASVEDFYGIPQYQADWIEFSPGRVEYLRHPFWDTLPMYNLILQRKINRQANILIYGDDLSEFRGIYVSKYFNERGDFIGHLGDKTPPGMNAEYGGFLVNQLDEAYSFLEDFNHYALSRGAIVYYEATASRHTNCEITGMRYIRKFYNTLQTRTTIPLLTNLDQLCLPDEYFYDTPYHLNEQGRRVRTERLIENLKTALPEMK